MQNINSLGRPSRALQWRRLALLLLAGFALLAGLDAGLLLLGLPAPVTTERLPAVHGILLTLGFVGTLVALERAVALARAWGFLAPVLLGVGGLLVVTPAPLVAGRLALLGGAGALVGAYVPLWRRQRDAAVLVQAFGAHMAAGGALLWLGGVEIPVLLPWLVAFLVLTIIGERLELARIGRLSGRDERGAVALGAAVVVGYPLLGLALLALVGWLVRFDVARRTIRGTGLPRFMAACLLTGYAWLAAAGAVWLLGGPLTAAGTGAAYDAAVHAVFLGFVMSMVMAHAPVILPAVLRRPLPYRPVLFAPPALLHGSLVLRLWVGDAHRVEAARQVGGALNALALLLFVALAAWSTARGQRTRRGRLDAQPGDGQVQPVAS